MTLIEIVITIAIVAMAMGAVTMSFRALAKSSLRSNASRLASASRCVYDRAITTGKYYRFTIDLETGSYKVERADERFYLSRDKEQSDGKGKAFDWEAQQKRLDAEEERAQQQLTGLAAKLQPPPLPRRPRFAAFEDSMLPNVQLKGVRIRDIYTPRQPEPYTEGKAYLYFFPDGHTERAVIHLTTEDGSDVYTLIVHSLSGRVELRAGDYEVPRGFDDTDDEGRTELGR